MVDNLNNNRIHFTNLTSDLKHQKHKKDRQKLMTNGNPWSDCEQTQ